jgi:hypothetical protein
MLTIVIGEGHGDNTDAYGVFVLPPATGRQRDGNGGGGHQHQDAGGVRAALGVGVEEEAD